MRTCMARKVEAEKEMRRIKREILKQIEEGK